jgi:hypothetical protein
VERARSDPGPIARTDVALALLLAAGTAAVVAWQNSRLAVLWDLSYVLENAWRIASGQVPYRDFPFPYAPGTFALQALIIRVFGRAIVHHAVYAILAAASATGLTYLLAKTLLGVSPAARAIAFCSSAPLVILGIYCIFPHPFYDPDCCLAVLLLLAALVRVARAGFPRGQTLLLGALCAVPALIKQNIGLAFLVSMACGAVLLALAGDDPSQRRGGRALLAGIGVGSLAGIGLITALFGFGNYVRWTIRFAAQRRLPPVIEQFAVYRQPLLAWWLLSIGAALLLARWRWRGQGMAKVAAGIAAAGPWIDSIWVFFTTDDPLEPEIDLLLLWPLALALVLIAIVAIAIWRRRFSADLLLPVAAVGAVHGALLSQSTWGSTYGIWPLFVVLLAWLAGRWQLPRLTAVIAAIVASVSMLISGWDYISNDRRLTYAKVAEGQRHESSLPALRGLHVRGPWLPAFEKLVAFAEANIPRDASILSMPGEDLFYFATGRMPAFPNVMFDRTISPYSAAEIVRTMDSRGTDWVIVKRSLQINGDPMPEAGEVLRLLAPRFELVARVAVYDVYRRKRNA